METLRSPTPPALAAAKQGAFPEPALPVSRSLARPAGSFRGLGRPLAVARTGLRSPGPLADPHGSWPAAALKPAASPGPRQLAGSPCLRDRRAPAGRSVDGQPAMLTSPSGAQPRPGLGNRAAARQLPEPPERSQPRALLHPPLGGQRDLN